MKSNLIFYVKDQQEATRFYTQVLAMPPTLNVPGMTEFTLNSGTVLGLMPERGIKQLLGNALPDPILAHGIPRAELYLQVDSPEVFHQRAVNHGAKELSPVSNRDWGHSAGYCADLDGHVIAFARELNESKNALADPQPEDSQKPHSADYFGEYRDFWWNRDFLELTAKRLAFDQVRHLLDVGCGVGHWDQTLAWVLPRDTRITGVDREASWVEKATARAQARGLGLGLGLGDRCEYRIGDVNHLPFPDGSFDMVTCQTVLIHVPEPEKALREMLRVLKPGGLLLAIEPSNLMNAAALNSISDQEPISEVVDRFRFALTCQRGKRALGLGFLSLGDLLPGILAKLEVKDIQVYISDKASPIFPPYEGEGQKALIQQMIDWSKNEVYIADKAETLRYFQAGGGHDAEFEKLWDLIQREGRALPKHIADQSYHYGGGGMHYLVSARRPS